MTAPDVTPEGKSDGLMVQLTRARNGSLSAESGGRLLYTRYDPQAEADRYVARILGRQISGTVIVLGAGLGYLTEAVRRNRPNVHVIAVYFSRLLFDNRITAADREWCAEDSRHSLVQFLERELPDEDLDGIVILEWAPLLRAFGSLAAESAVSLRDFLDRRAATLATERVFGSRWIRNSVANAVSVQPAVLTRRAGHTVIIAAAGPSLQQAMERFADRDADTALWALPSSLPILLNAGYRPDLVVATDAGHYAAAHLHPLSGSVAVPVAAPLSAAAAPAMRRQKVLLLDQGSWYERGLLQALQLPAVQLPPHGTVAGTALYLASAVGAEKVIYAGLDLCVHDVRSHPRGHSFDRLLLPGQRRLRPYYHDLYERNCLGGQQLPGHPYLRTSRALRTYAAWFRGAMLAGTPPVARLHPSPVDLGMEEYTALASRAGRPASEISARPPRPRGLPPPGGRLWLATPDSARCTSSSDRYEAVAGCLRDWRQAVERLPERVGLPRFGNDGADRQMLEICRTIDTGAYLRLMRAQRNAAAADNDAGTRHELESACGEILQSARRLFDILDRRVERFA